MFQGHSNLYPGLNCARQICERAHKLNMARIGKMPIQLQYWPFYIKLDFQIYLMIYGECLILVGIKSFSNNKPNVYTLLYIYILYMSLSITSKLNLNHNLENKILKLFDFTFIMKSFITVKLMYTVVDRKCINMIFDVELNVLCFMIFPSKENLLKHD